MCGIAGLLGPGARDEALVARMTGRLAHRGPDDEGLWVDPEARIALGHRRLAIIDPTPAGHEPIFSRDGRWSVTFNGEIYNHDALRREVEAALGGPPQGGWRGHCDVETLVEAIALWDLAEALAKSAGMFALAAWDRRDRRLLLARDRFGEKPLYYGWAGEDLLFASELKAFRTHPRFAAEVERRVLRAFAARGYVPAPWSIYRKVFKVEPGSIVAIDGASGAPAAADAPLPGTPYWSYRDLVAEGLAQQFASEGEALDALEQALAQAVQGQAVADVPVGAFLSGGIDSSTIVAFYQKYSNRRVRTYTVGFDDPRFDEAGHAAQVAAALGTDHNAQMVTVAEAQQIIPLLPAMFDEPISDSSQIPTYLVSRHARSEVTVALSGDGGDELFGGYNRYVHAARLWPLLAPVPQPLRRLAAAAIPDSAARALARMTGKASPDGATKIHKMLRAAAANSFAGFFDRYLDEWDEYGSPLANGVAGEVAFLQANSLPGNAPYATRMMLADALSYLPDDILCKVDRASMAVSLEARAPFLDPRVAEVAAKIPAGITIRGGTGKQVLRRLLFREVPERLFDRPKTGFTIPVGEWVKGPLRDWAEELLDPQRLARDGWFEPAVVRRRWDDHLSGRRDATAALWGLLMFQAWLDDQRAPTTDG